MNAVIFGCPHKDGAADETILPQIIAGAQAINADVVIGLGDSKGTTGGNFDRFMAEIWPVKYRMRVIPGNWDQISGDWTLYNDLARSLNGAQNRFYHWQTGEVTFIALDVWHPSEAPPTCTDYSVQQAYLTDVLAQSTTPFNIVLLHTPMYNSSAKGPNLCARYAFKQIIEDAGNVQAVFSAHRHNYERYWFSGGPQYITTGGAGGANHPVDPNPVTGREAASNDYHACMLQTFVQGDELILHAEAYNVNQELIDWWEASVPYMPAPVKDATKKLTRM